MYLRDELVYDQKIKYPQIVERQNEKIQILGFHDLETHDIFSHYGKTISGSNKYKHGIKETRFRL